LVSRNPKLEHLLELMYLAYVDRFGDKQKAKKDLKQELLRLAKENGCTPDEVESAAFPAFHDYKISRRRRL
jgi:hypothetical protein